MEKPKKKQVLLYHCVEAEDLARKVASVSEHIQLQTINWRSFADGFPNLFINNAQEIRGQHVAFLASFSSPAVIFEQLSVIFALPRLFVASFTLVLPFFPTGSFERMEEEGDVATAFTMARILSNIPISRGGPTSLVIYDIHALQERFYFGDQVLPLFETGIPLLKQRLQQFPKSEKIVVAFPDDGAWKRFHKLLDNYPTVVCTKVREGDKRIVRLKEGNPAGCHVVIVDDLVQSGGTLIECQKVLAAHGAAKVSAYVTHGVFPKHSYEQFLHKNDEEGCEKAFAYFWITDSCPLTVKAIDNRAPFEVLSLAGSIAAWSTSPIGHPFTSSRRGQAHPYSSRQSSFLGSQHHVGSAPSGIPLDGQFGFFPESPETSYMNQVAFGSTGSNSRNQLMNAGTLNIGVAIAGNFSESGSPSSRMMMPLSRNGPAFYGNGSYGGIGASNLEVLNDRSRNRRVDGGNQVDNKKQYQLDLEKIINGEDTRTTLMIKNIPNKYTSKMLLAAIDESHNGAYDFLYLPIDFKNKCNVGYAFINMVSPSHIISFYEVFNGKKWEKFNSEKVASLAYARIQGKVALVAHFQNSSLMNEDKRCRPILIQSEGESERDQELFPSSNLNICIRQPDGSYTGDSLDSPKGNLDENLEKSSQVSGSGGADSWP